MATVTRHALRVYAALEELRGGKGDVLDALIPFLEPILQVMKGRIFEPQLLAIGAQKLYRWRINKDIAQQFIPRLASKGYLKRKGTDDVAAYVVTYSPPPESSNVAKIEVVLKQIIDQFEAFPPRVTDLLSYRRTREELTDILVRFLVSLDAYGEAAFAAEVRRLNSEGQRVLGLIPEGGAPLPSDDRYMCARFVKEICDESPDFVPHLARLASIGLLTEVVEDFVKPTKTAERTNLTLVLDTPVALDYLGCSGKELQEDVKTVLDTLRQIGCGVVVFPVTCSEIQNNLTSMLNLPGPNRHGYTHEAMRKGEVLETFVQAVARNPEKALEQAGVRVRSVTLAQYPGQHHFFDSEKYEDFFSTITWGNDVAAREHDATCFALLLRLREGRHSSDVFRCGYVFVTRNATFAKRSRAYCLEARIINQTQEGPIIHQRELATTAWLRTGLGAALDIPRSTLISTCDRVLRLRSEVQQAVAATLLAAPDKMDQFNLLIQDYRSIRKLADETLNDERVVSPENADLLLEAMRQATIAEEKEKIEKEFSTQHVEDRKLLAEALKTIREMDVSLRHLEARREEDEQRAARAIQRVVDKTNDQLRFVEIGVTVILLALGGLAIVDFSTGWPSGRWWWGVVTAVGGLAGLYHLIAHILGRPIVGFSSILNRVGRILVTQRLRRLDLQSRPQVAQLEYSGGRISTPQSLLTASLPSKAGRIGKTLFDGDR